MWNFSKTIITFLLPDSDNNGLTLILIPGFHVLMILNCFITGSSFPKAKPKQTLLTVLRLAVLRFLFLPLYAKWWVEQTSPKVFTLLLLVYLVQMFNWGVYSINVNRLGPDTDQDHIVSMSELLIPVALSLILSVIHSQIVATASNVSKSEKQRQPQQQTGGKHKRKRERVKRRKKNSR